MNYINSLSAFGVDAREIPCLTDKGIPTTATVGAVGMLYMDTDTGALYKCTAAADGLYTWVAAEGGKDSHWKGKKWIAFGTSLTDTASMNAESGEVTGKYVPYLVASSGLIVTNHGKSGGTIATGGVHSASGSILAKILATDISDADLITIEGFVNDFACAVSLGQVTDTGNTTLCGALYQAIKYCLENSNATVVLLTDSTGKKYTLSSTGNEADYQVTKANSIDLKQVDYNNAIIQMAQYMGVHCIDAGGKSQINCFHPAYLIDHIHHTELGGKQYAAAIWEELKNIPCSVETVLEEPLPDEDEPAAALWDLASRTELTAEEAGVTLTTSVPKKTLAGTESRTISYEKYVRGATSNGNWGFGEGMQPVLTNITDTGFTMQIKTANVGLGMPMDLEVGKAYKITYTADNTHRLYATYFDESGIYAASAAIDGGSEVSAGTYTRTFTPADHAYLQLTFRAGVSTVTFSDIVIEEVV